MRGARRSLFASPSKEKPQLVADDTILAEEEPAIVQPSVQAVVNDVAPAGGDKDDEIVNTKTKRSTNSSKSGGSAKKGKL